MPPFELRIAPGAMGFATACGATVMGWGLTARVPSG